MTTEQFYEKMRDYFDKYGIIETPENRVLYVRLKAVGKTNKDMQDLTYRFKND